MIEIIFLIAYVISGTYYTILFGIDSVMNFMFDKEYSIGGVILTIVYIPFFIPVILLTVSMHFADKTINLIERINIKCKKNDFVTKLFEVKKIGER